MQQDLFVSSCNPQDSLMEWSSDFIVEASSQQTAMMQVETISTRIRSQKRQRKPKLRYSKRRFSPVKLNDLMPVVVKPTHCVRLVFPDSKRWIHFEGLANRLSDINVPMTTDYHVTIALIHADAGECFGNLLHLTPLLKDALLEFTKLCILGKTLAILASEDPWFTGIKKTKDDLTIPKAVEWLKEHGYEIYNSQLPLHMSLAKLHDLQHAEYAQAVVYCQQFNPQEFALPSALQVVKIDGGKVNGKSIPLVHLPINNNFRFIPSLYHGR